MKVWVVFRDEGVDALYLNEDAAVDHIQRKPDCTYEWWTALDQLDPEVDALPWLVRLDADTGELLDKVIRKDEYGEGKNDGFSSPVVEHRHSDLCPGEGWHETDNAHQCSSLRSYEKQATKLWRRVRRVFVASIPGNVPYDQVLKEARRRLAALLSTQLAHMKKEE